MASGDFKLGDIVCLEDGSRAKIINIEKPMGTYSIYIVQSMNDGSVERKAKHQLVKHMPDDAIEFEEAPDIDADLLAGLFASEMSESTETMHSSENITTTTPIISPPTPNNRFIYMEDDDVNDFIEQNENVNTRKKTLSHIKLVQSFLLSIGVSNELHSLAPAELDRHLAKFFVVVRQKDGSEYQPSYLRGIMGSIERHLRRHKYGRSLIRDVNFSATRAALTSKQKDLKKKGKGNRPMAADFLSNSDVDRLYETGQLGSHCPTSLLNTLWFNNTLHFGMRGGSAEHRNLCYGDMKLGFDTELECEFVEYNERQTKTRTGADVNNIRHSAPRMYATGDERCPVAVFKKFQSKRPARYCEPNHPFYLGIATHKYLPSEDEQWFLSAPVGKNKIANLMQNMAKNANMPGLQSKRKTNSSVRKHLCQKLIENEVPDTQAIHITGHKNTESLNNYRTINPGMGL